MEVNKKKKRISKVHTGVGDRGKTQLVDGSWVSKDSPFIHAIGTVDELNSVIGIILSFELPNNIRSQLKKIQNDLFILGTDIATPGEINVPRVTLHMIQNLEKWIDEYNGKLGPLQEFILPGGSTPASFAHLARTVARRAERHITSLFNKNLCKQEPLVYVNRLSDYFFNLARWLNKLAKVNENFVDFGKPESK